MKGTSLPLLLKILILKCRRPLIKQTKNTQIDVLINVKEKLNNKLRKNTSK